MFPLILCQIMENKCASSIHLVQLEVTGSISTVLQFQVLELNTGT